MQDVLAVVLKNRMMHEAMNEKWLRVALILLRMAEHDTTAGPLYVTAARDILALQAAQKLLCLANSSEEGVGQMDVPMGLPQMYETLKRLDLKCQEFLMTLEALKQKQQSQDVQKPPPPKQKPSLLEKQVSKLAFTRMKRLADSLKAIKH